MRRLLALFSAVLGLVGLCAVPATALTPHPPTVTHLHAVSTSSTTVTLSWANPHSSSFRSTIVRYAAGTTAPRTATSGHLAGHPGAHTQTLRLSHLAAGHHYAFAFFPVLTHHRFGARSAIVGLAAPAAPTGALPFVASTGMRITWANPHTSTFRKVVVRFAAGSAAPSAPSHGHGVALSSSRPSSAVVPHLLTNTHYSVSVFALDYRGGWSNPDVVRFTTPASAEHAGTYTGTVTDTHGNALDGAVVEASDPRSGDDHTATTGADGTFSLPLRAAEYFVSIGGQHITGGGAADAAGYVPASDDVVVRAGHTTTSHYALAAGGTITGRFTDTAGHPLAGVTPVLEPVGTYVQDNSDFGFFFADGPNPVFADASQPDGTFVIRGVDPSGAVRLCADTSGTVTGGNTDAAGYSSRCADRSVLAVVGNARTAPDLALDPATGTTVSGTVTAAHAGVPDAFVWLSAGDGSGSDLFDITDSSGHFSISDVPAGSYQVCAGSNFVSSRLPTGAQTGCNRAPVVVGASPVIVGVTLQPGAAVTGTVRGPGAHRVSGADVIAQNRQGGRGASTGTQGQYTIVGLPTGSFQICVSSPATPTALLPTGVLPGCVDRGRAQHVTAGTERSGLDVTLPAGSAISGTVTDANGHAVVAAVDVESVDDENFEGSGAITDAHGHYTVAGLPADTYQVCFQAVASTGSGGGDCAPRTVGTRLGRTSTHVDGQLPAVSAIDVSVTDAGGAPVAGVDVVALSPCSQDGCTKEPVFSPTTSVAVDASFVTNSGGHALLNDLSPGTYAVCLFAYNGTTASGGSPTGYADSCKDHDFTVAVTRGDTAAVTLLLADGGAVSGRVTDGSSNPVTGAQATVSNSAATDVNDNSDGFNDGGDDSPSNGGFSASDGTYSVIGVQPGSQTVCVDASFATGSSSPGGYLGQCLGAAPGSTTGGTPVTVAADTVTTGVDFALSPGGGIAGTIRHGATPLASDTAEAVVFSGRNVHVVVAVVPTDGAGRYAVTGLMPGDYTVCFDSEDFSAQCWRGIAWTGQNPPLDRATLVSPTAGTLVTGIDGNLR